MKKLFNLILSAAITASMISCNNGTGKTDSSAEESILSYKTIIVNQADDSMGIQFKFVIDFPVQGPDSLVNEIKRNIFLSLGDSTCSDLTENGLQDIADKYVRDSRDELKDMQTESSEHFSTSFTYDGGIKIIENTDKYVTYNINTYMYTGGAHGMPYKGYVTIDKKSYKTLSMNDIFLEDKMEDLKQLIKSNLVSQYYKGEQPAWDDELFKFDLPQQNPAITTEGVVFSYGAYEIDCFAAGLPYCVIPYEDIMDIMTDKAKALIN